MDSETQKLVAEFVVPVAADLVKNMLAAAGRRVARGFEPDAKRQALDRAMQAALVEAVSTMPLENDLRDHYEEIFGTFLSDQAVVKEFAGLLDPKEGQLLDLSLLEERFAAAGYSTDLLPGVDFRAFVSALAQGFSDKADLEDDLHGVIEIKLLRELVRQGNRGEPRDDELDALEARLRLHYVRWFQVLSFQGMMATPTPLAIPLKDIYVPSWSVACLPEVDVLSTEDRELSSLVEETDEEARRQIQYQLDSAQHKRLAGEDVQRVPVTQIVTRADKRAAIVLGDPGGGKTTLLRYLALVLSEGAESAGECLGISGQEARRLPIFFPLAAFDQALSLTDQMSRYYHVHHNLAGMGPVFERALKNGNALLLFDGLDEVVEPVSRREVSLRLKAFLDEQLPLGNRAILTSRFYGYREARVQGGFPHFSLLGFGRAEVQTFAHKWSLAYETWVDNGERTPETVHKAGREERNLLQQIHSNPSVERLAVNPLLLSMLALLVRQSNTLPSRRVKLYQAYTDVLIEQWQKVRQPGMAIPSPQRYDLQIAVDVLIPLAFWLHSEKPSATATRAEIQAQLKAIFLRRMGCTRTDASAAECREALKEAEDFLHDMRQFSGLLVERGRDAYGFLHLTFQEYFAARSLARMSRLRRKAFLANRLHDDRWREPIFLCAGQLGVVESRQDEVTAFLRWILDKGSADERYIHRDLLLAAACASDDVNADASLLGEIANSLALLFTPPVVSLLAGEAGQCLGRMTQLRSVARKASAAAVSLLAHGNPDVREAAAEALGSAALDPDVYAAFLQALRDEYAGVRRGAARALRPAASDPEVRAALLNLLGDEDSGVRRAAAQGLGSAASDPEVQAALAKLLRDLDWLVRWTAAQALGAVSDPEVRAVFLKLLGDEDSGVREAAAEALGSVASDPGVQAALLNLLGDRDSDVRGAAAQALGSAGSDPEVRTALLSLLRDEDSDVRRAAVESLGSVATVAEVREGLLKLVRDENVRVRRAAVWALGSAASDPEVRAALLKILGNGISDVGWDAARALGSTASDDPQVRAALLKLLKHKDSQKRRAGAWALGSAASDPEVRKAVLELLGDRDFYLRRAAVKALRSGPSDSVVRVALMKSLADKDSYVRRAVAEALGSAASDPEVRVALLSLLGDEDSDVRDAAYASVMQGLAGETVTGDR